MPPRRVGRMHKERDMTLPQDNPTLLGRVWNAAEQGPSVVTVRDGRVIDVTTKDAPLVRDICAMDDPTGYVRAAATRAVIWQHTSGSVAEEARAPTRAQT